MNFVDAGQPGAGAEVPDRTDAILARKHIYVAWVRYQRRPEAMKSFVGYDLRFLPQPYQKNWQKPFGYMKQAFATWSRIWREKPDVVWFQQPPTFVAHVIVLARMLGLGRFQIVADCHNSALDTDIPGNFWPRIPGAKWALNRCDVVIAHNSAVKQKALQMGLDPDRLVVLETRPTPLSEATTNVSEGRPVILVPCSYRDDEPIGMLLEAAAKVPQADFMLTGNRDKAAKKGFVAKAPANVTFTGFLTPEDYTRLLTTCSVVLGLTVSEGIQLSAANEAVGANRAMVLSDTVILRDLFGQAALFATNEVGPMAAALAEALERQQELILASAALKSVREKRWQSQMRACLNMLS